METLTAERIYKELLHEQAAVWFIDDSFGAKVMIKATSASIKAVMKGCKVEFLFGKDTTLNPAIFHQGVRIYDDPVHYLSITGINRFLDEHTSLSSIMGRNYTHIHFHNELGICVATAKLAFSVCDQMRVTNFLGDLKNLYCGDYDAAANRSLDCFEYSLKMEKPFENVYEIDTVVVGAMISEWVVLTNHFVGTNEHNKILVDALDEGTTFEQEVWVSLTGLFGKNVYRNPEIFDKKKFRELTDVFAFYDNGLFFIESKALGVVAATGERSMTRKVAGLQKQITTGIGQLAGAWKKVQAGVTVVETGRKEKIFDYGKFTSNCLPHCIVLVSELLPFGDWKPIEMLMFDAMAKNKIYLHVMDLREFMQYVGHSRGNKDRLNLMLIERVENLVRHESIHMKLTVVEEKTIK